MSFITIKRAIKGLLNALGFEVHRKELYLRSSLLGILRQAKNVGFSPATVIDVGAFRGDFTLDCLKVFPNAKYLLIEPLEECKPYLDKLISVIPNLEYILAAATYKSGEVTLNVHHDLVGSSIYLEDEDSDPNVNGIPRVVPAITLDEVCKKHATKAPYLIKIDVQGAELDVLSGAKEIIKEAEYIILEVSFFQFFKCGPQFYDVVEFMKSQGFVAYDIFYLQFRPLDQALSQCDIAFVREDGLFRRCHFYATREQMERHNKIFRKFLNIK